MTSALGEFGRIAAIFAPLSAGYDGAFALADDAALVTPDLVVTTDTIVEGLDFLPDDPPELVARKLLRVNLSDLAAMGARPECYLLTTILPARCDDRWVASFAAGLAMDQELFNIRLIGGDTGSTPGPITLSATLFGRVGPRGVVRRSGARPDDLIFVSGTVGDSALGLLSLTKRLAELDGAAATYLADRYRLPQPRIALGLKLAGVATAMIDISDGLAADLGHLATASGFGATIESRLLPLSDAAATVVASAPELMERVLSGGDDYELLFTAPPDSIPGIMKSAAESWTPVHCIGRMTGAGVRILDAGGEEFRLEITGWKHA